MAQTIILPGKITRDRAIQVFAFDELPADVQDRMIAKRMARADYEHFADMLREDHVLDLENYWIPEHLAPNGFEVQSRYWQNSNGYRGSEPLIFWECQYSYDVFFSAHVDLETYLLKHKLGNRFRALLLAWRRGDINGATVGTDSDRRSPAAEITLAYPADLTFSAVKTSEVDFYTYQEREPVYRTVYVPDSEQWQRLETQAAALERHLLETYESLTRDIESSFQKQAEYYGSEEYYRDELTEIDADILYDISGTPITPA